MALKRQHREGGDGDLQIENKRRHLVSTIFKGASRIRNLEEFVPMLEPIIRKWVKEEVSRAIDPYLSRSMDSESERRSLQLQLQFDSSLPATLFTGNRIASEGAIPVKISLYDPSCQQIVTSGPYSSIKVRVVVLQGGLVPDDWSRKEFNNRVVHNREGKRPLLNGEEIVVLKNGVGYVGNICFTDNSSWDRSGKFRLGLKLHSSFDEASVREGVSNAFKVKDQRGESYQKHHPPSLDDEVWRLEKIAKDGAYHKQLSKLGISSVGDFLRSHAMNRISLRTALHSISKKKWETITAHAATCILDDKKYIYTSPQGTALLFNSIYNLIGVTFDGLTYHSMHSLNAYQMKTVEELKQRAFENLGSWGRYEAVGKGEVEMQINVDHPTLENRLFELGESSEMQGFNNLTFSNSLGMSDDGFYIDEDFEEH